MCMAGFQPGQAIPAGTRKGGLTIVMDKYGLLYAYFGTLQLLAEAASVMAVDHCFVGREISAPLANLEGKAWKLGRLVDPSKPQ